jgi:putative long chain acyl-CoA synthase
LFNTGTGPVAPRPIEDALGALPGVRATVAYGIPIARDTQLAAAAVTVHGEAKLEPALLTRSLAALAPADRPSIVRVVQAIPVTASYRPITRGLRDEGLPTPDGATTFYLDAAGRYRPLTEAARRRLTKPQPQELINNGH